MELFLAQRYQKCSESRLYVPRTSDRHQNANRELPNSVYVFMYGCRSMILAGMSYGFVMHARDFTGFSFGKYDNLLLAVIRV